MLRKSSYWKNVNPTGAIGDFLTVYRQAGSNRWRIGAVAAALTIGVFSIMATQSWKGPRPLPEITYINSWPEDRTPEETRAFIEANQKAKEEREAREAMAAEESRKLWETVGRATGVDVDKMKAKIEADKAAERAQAQAAEKAKVER